VGLLDDLKKQADALKAQDVDKTESLRSSAVTVDHALRRLFLYLNDLGKQINVVQMPCPFIFDLPTVGKVDGLIIKDFFCDFRACSSTSTTSASRSTWSRCRARSSSTCPRSARSTG